MLLEGGSDDERQWEQVVTQGTVMRCRKNIFTGGQMFKEGPTETG